MEAGFVVSQPTEEKEARKMLHRRRLGFGLGTALALTVAAVLSGGGVPQAGAQACTYKPYGKIVNGVVRFCGPATAKLSAFPGVTFRNGQCYQPKNNGNIAFELKMGARTLNMRTNGGMPSFELIVSGSLSHPTGGGVIAYWNGKRWGGPGISFKGDARSGTFVVRGINGSHGTATGSYRC
jgi:hypothetical protein